MIEQVSKNNSQPSRNDLGSEGLSEVGRELKEAREALGISVAEMANALRIRSVHIDSLEAGRFDELPGRPYTLGFARSIATHLGLDSDAVSMRLRDEVTGAAAPVELIFPESTEDKRLSRAGWIAISLALVAVAYGGWLALSPRRDAGPPEFASVNAGSAPSAPVPSAEPEPSVDVDAADDNASQETVVEAPSASLPVLTTPSGSAPPPVVAKSPVTAVAKPEPAPVALPVVAAKPPTPVATASPPPASVAPVGPPPVATHPAQPQPANAAPSAAQTAPASDASADDEEEDTAPEPTTLAVAPSSATPVGRVTLRARQDSWVQIQSADGVTVMARTLRAGDSYTVPDRPGLRLTTGNAGALDVFVDGQVAPPIGQIGTVRRNVALDPARLKAGAALE